MTEKESIFAEAIRLNGDERRAFLQSACGRNFSLLEDVQSLVEAHEQLNAMPGSDALEDLAGQSIDPNNLLEQNEMPVLDDLAGQPIGQYHLLQAIGEGGMGVVYLAEQSEPVERRVALKIVKPGLDTREVIARFEAERQALAMMDHPHIARVLDAGTSATGRPYFVMELVKGESITEFCQRHRLSLPDRLQLFISVCRAVQHAHQKGIIHRDLKPSNVLVAFHEGDPVPKVIDFGIAKALNQKLTNTTLHTQFGQVLGTLEYMSPEQARYNQLDVDTRSDVYSLGAVLYELLVGTPPFSCEKLKSLSMDERLRIIREEEPVKPSSRIKWDTVRGQGYQRESRHRRVGVELDWIILKAIDKEPARRYETASAMADDLCRFLDDQPITACPPSSWYLARKFVTRHRRAIAVVGLLLFTLVAGLIGTTVGFYRARRLANRVVAEQTEMRGLVRRMQGQLDVLKSVPRSREVQLELSQEVYDTFNRLLEAHGNDDQLRNDTAISAQQLAIVHVRNGNHEQARRIATHAATLLTRLQRQNTEHDQNRELLLSECNMLVGLTRERMLDPGAYRDYEVALKRIRNLELADPANNIYGFYSLALNHRLATVAYHLGDVARSQEHRRRIAQSLQAKAQRKSEKNQDWAAIGEARVGSELIFGMGLSFQLSRPHLQTIVDGLVAYELKHPASKVHLWGSANLDWQRGRHASFQGDWQLAIEKLKAAIDKMEQTCDFDKERARQLGHVYRELSNCYLGAESYQEAEDALLRSLELARQVPPGFTQQPEETGTVHQRLAALYHFLGDDNKSKRHFHRAFEIHTEFYRTPTAYPRGSRRLVVLLATCPFDEIRDPERAVAIAEESVRESPDNSRLWFLLGVARYNAGQYGEAIAALEQSGKIGNVNYVFAPLFLAMAYSQHGQLHLAQAAYQNAQRRISQGERWSFDFTPLDFRRIRSETESLMTDNAIWKTLLP